MCVRVRVRVHCIARAGAVPNSAVGELASGQLRRSASSCVAITDTASCACPAACAPVAFADAAPADQFALGCAVVPDRVALGGEPVERDGGQQGRPGEAGRQGGCRAGGVGWLRLSGLRNLSVPNLMQAQIHISKPPE